jgi:hypothetical protein
MSGITASQFKEIKPFFKMNNNYVEKKKDMIPAVSSIMCTSVLFTI